MSKKFCPKCGKATDSFHDSLCGECFLEDKSSVHELPKSVKVRRCKICGRFSSSENGAWFDSMESAVEDEFKKLSGRPRISSVNFHIDSRSNRVFVTVRSEFDGLEKEEAKELDLSLKAIACKYCFMKGTGYHQAVLQMRLPKELMGDVLDEVVKQLSIMNYSDPQAFVSKIERKGEGVDLYIGSKKAAKRIVGMLRKDLNVKTKMSNKLAGKLKGKDVYRDTILVTI